MKHFKLFKRLKEKNDKSSTDESLECTIKERKGYTHIPAEAFYQLYSPDNRYSHLKDGLYIGNTSLLFDERVETAAKDLGFSAMQSVNSRVTGHNYYGFKFILDNMGSRMMNLAEFLCVHNWVNNNKGYATLGKDLHQNFPSEWLDNVYTKGENLYINPETTVPGDIKGEPVKIKQPAHDHNNRENYYTFEEMDNETGFPTKLTQHGNITFHIPDNDQVGFQWCSVRGHIVIHLRDKPTDFTSRDMWTHAREAIVPTIDDKIFTQEERK